MSCIGSLHDFIRDNLCNFRSIFGKRVQEVLSNVEPSKCLMSQNGDMIFDAVDYRQTQYCVDSSGETYLKDNGQNDNNSNNQLEMHTPRFDSMFILYSMELSSLFLLDSSSFMRMAVVLNCYASRIFTHI